MNLELFVLNGYGQFVWPAFIFTFVSCLMLYISTRKKLKKIEKIYLCEFKQLDTIKIKTVKKEGTTRAALSSSSI